MAEALREEEKIYQSEISELRASIQTKNIISGDLLKNQEKAQKKIALLMERLQKKDRKLQEEEESRKNLELKYKSAKKKFDQNLVDMDINKAKISELSLKMGELKAKGGVLGRQDLGSRLRALRDQERAKISVSKERIKHLGRARGC